MSVKGSALPREVKIEGVPNEKQAEFFSSKARFTAYGGARGGGKSWALRRKLVTLCLRYPGIRCLLLRRTYAELKSNHLYPMLEEYGSLFSYSDSEKIMRFVGGSSISLGYCDAERDVLRYQGQEYDVIAIDEATQLSEMQFSVLKACLRGVRPFPRRMYLTCNPGGIGHAWVKRLFIDRSYREGEKPSDHSFIPARLFDNPILTEADPEYVDSLRALPDRLRRAWLYGEWDVFEGQFFPEFSESVHVVGRESVPRSLTYFASADYGLDMFALLLLGVDRDGNVWCIDELCQSGLTLGDAGRAASRFLSRFPVRYLTVSPDLYNRRQDSGLSGIEIFAAEGCPLPPVTPADNRRVQGWRTVREYLSENTSPFLRISEDCKDLITSLPSLTCDPIRNEDASDHPHEITHSPEALRYALMSRALYREEKERDLFKDF